MISLPSRSLYLVDGPSISSLIPSRTSFLGSAALPICAGMRSRERVGNGIKIPLPLSTGSRWGRDHDLAPSISLNLLCDSVAFKFPGSVALPIRARLKR